MNISDIGAIAVFVILAIFLLGILKKPIKLLFKLIFNTVLGFIALFAINWLGGFLGISVGINLINAVIVGVLGIPGVALLLIAGWLF